MSQKDPECFVTVDLGEYQSHSEIRNIQLEFSNLLERALQATCSQYFSNEEPKILETTYFLAMLHAIAKELDGKSFRTPVQLMKELVLLVEFKIDARKYSSFIVAPPEDETDKDGEEEHIKISQHRLLNTLETLLNEFNDPHRPISEKKIRRNMKLRTLGVPKVDAGHLSKSLQEREEADCCNAVLAELMAPLTSHLLHTYGNQSPDFIEQLTHAQVVNAFNRALLQRWQDLLELNAGEEGSPFTYPERVRAYPFLRLHEFDEYLLVVCVTPLDEGFVDEKVKKDHRICNVSLGIFDVRDQTQYLGSLSSQTEASLRFTLGRLNGIVTAQRNRLALQYAAGEASLISRFWYSDGIVNLLERRDDGRGALEEETTLDFWHRFVEDLLCAKVAGVKETEVFPFDRAFLIDWTGASEPGDQSGVAHLRVIETGLRSKDPKDKNQHQTSSQRGDKPLSRYDLTDKKIKLVTDWLVTTSNGIVRLKNSKPIETEQGVKLESTFESPGEPTEEDLTVPIELKIKTLLWLLAEQDKDEAMDVQGQIWNHFPPPLALSYDYAHGLNLAEDLPSVYALQAAYLDATGQNIINRTSKVVYISFDPELLPKDFNNLLSSDDRFTLMLVADDDPPKSVSELNSERDDLRLLLRMIIRQRLREKKREDSLLRDKVEMVNSSLRAFMHRFTGEHRDVPEDVRHEIIELYRGLQPILSLKPESLVTQSFEPTPQNILWFLVQDRVKSEAGEQVARDLNSILEELAVDYGQGENLTGCIRVLDSLIRPFEARWPLAAVKEAFAVMLKNAVEAATAHDAPRPISIQIEIQMRPATDKRGTADPKRWFVDIIIDNTTAEVPAEVLKRLNATTPEMQGKNKNKNRSSGIGVFTVRNQLRRGISHGADIHFGIPGPGRIQARMSLPVQLTERTAVEQIPAKTEAAVTTDYILYLEDDERHATPSIEYLSKMSTIPVIHHRSAIGAISRCEDRLPKLAITDLTVVRQENESSQTASNKYGLEFLQVIMSKTADAKKKPPIWVLSSRSSEETWQLLQEQCEVQQHGYARSAPTPSIKPGTIYIGDYCKSVEDLPEIVTLMKEFISGRSTGIRPRRTTDVHTPVLDLKTTPLNDPEFSKSLQEYAVARENMSAVANENVSAVAREKKPTSVAQGFMATASASTIQKLIQHVSTWFKLAGLPDPEAIVRKNVPKPLWDTMAHREVLLLITTPEPLLQSLSADWIYWLIRHNIVVTSMTAPPLEQFGQWERIVKDPKGILSVVRHDLINFAVGNRHVPEFLKEINECDAKLRHPEWDDFFLHSIQTDDLESLEKRLVEGDLKKTLEYKRTCADDMIRIAEKLKDFATDPDQLSRIKRLVSALLETAHYLSEVKS